MKYFGRTRLSISSSSSCDACPDTCALPELPWITLAPRRYKLLIVFETDFPHPDSKYPHATDEFFALLPDQISEESKRKVLWDNAVDLYRFPDEYLPAR